MDALVIIDIQNDYFPGGAAALSGPESAAANAARLLEKFRKLGKPVFHVQHVSIREGASFFVPDTPGVAIHDAVKPLAGETVVRKHFPNAFRDTDLEEALRLANARHLCVAGMMSHMCIDTSVRAAADKGYGVTLAHDACATKDLKFGDTGIPAAQVHAAYMAALNGSFGRVLATEAILAELSER
jgi:nicotinamidase-related amidase